MKLFNWFKKHKHDYRLIINDEIDVDLTWYEQDYMTSTAFSPSHEIKKTYKGKAFLVAYYCHLCKDWQIYICAPEGRLPISDSYVLSLLYQRYNDDEFKQKCADVLKQNGLL